MKPPVLDYVAPRTLEEAALLLADDSREAKVLAGGQSLVPMLNMRLSRPEVLVDIARVRSLDYIEADSDRLAIGAAVTQADAARHLEVQANWPLVAAAISHIGHAQIRNRGTVVGSLAHHDPAAELPALALALDATLTAYSTRGPRVIEVADFFLGTFQTDLADDEILVQVSLAAPPPRTGWSFREVARKHGDFASVGAITLVSRGAAGVEWARLVLFGVGATPYRAVEAEQLLVGQHVTPEVLGTVSAAAVADLRPPSDVHATAEYRREVAASLIRTTVEEAWRRSA